MNSLRALPQKPDVRQGGNFNPDTRHHEAFAVTKKKKKKKRRNHAQTVMHSTVVSVDVEGHKKPRRSIHFSNEGTDSVSLHSTTFWVSTVLTHDKGYQLRLSNASLSKRRYQIRSRTVVVPAMHVRRRR